MNKFFRWYYQNKSKFWVTVLVIIGSYGLLLVFNSYSKQTNQKTYVNNTGTNYANSNTVASEYSVLSEETMKSEDLKEANSIIDKFITYCNEKNVYNAYNLISDKCKEDMFPTIEDFAINYYNKIFKTSKIYEMQNWSGKTYQIKFIENPMETRDSK